MPRKDQLNVEDLKSWKLLDEFRAALAKIPASHSSDCQQRKGGPKRLLQEEQYLCAFLFAQFNPVLTSMRSLCAASEFSKVQEQVTKRKISLGSFSEAQAVFGFERLETLFTQMAAESLQQAKPNKKIPASLLARVRLIDSSVFHAVPRMGWAHWRGGKRKGSAVRLHLSFNLLDKEPDQVAITTAKVCERAAFGTMLKEGEFYVGDRNYGRDYKLLKKMDEHGCGYVIRLCEQARVTVLEDLPLRAKGQKAGVVSDQIVRLGANKRWHLGPVRLVRIEKPELEEPLLLVTNQLSNEDFPACLIGEVYWSRWEIELFFRWLKCIFGSPEKWHWFAESADGVGIQLYCALIAALLLSRRLGKLPTKRMQEALQLHQMDYVTTEELLQQLEKAFKKI